METGRQICEISSSFCVFGEVYSSLFLDAWRGNADAERDDDNSPGENRTLDGGVDGENAAEGTTDAPDMDEEAENDGSSDEEDVRVDDDDDEQPERSVACQQYCDRISECFVPECPGIELFF